MKDAQPIAIQLTDYTEPNYFVEQTHLRFELSEDYTLVTATLTFKHNEKRPQQLVLNGQQLELQSLTINGQPVPETGYQVDGEQLVIDDVPVNFTLTVVTKIDPAANTALEGLYCSNGMYCTQCEAEGFRRITYYPDRPDVMSVFTTEIIADAEKYPVLLSNGNLIEESVDNGLRRVIWHDPHKKPAYLFALVAGDLCVKKDSFTTMSGRDVELRIYVEARNSEKTDYALDALKRSMRWDEETYGREYDLDLFMIVAVDDFNMGAMENKGLNIFNSSCVLASPDSATDAAYQRIEAIVAHEYFHNWSGNRVTCRDWFQLSLKEGFTVFRDAHFSADMNSETVKRIEDAKIMRTVQFAEDAGPLAHPVQPDSYIEISNFYTVTIYEKGAEVVGMLRRILGKEGFRKGSDLYFDRHDGQAVTIHEFVDAMADANQVDLTLFKRWYKQAGTPVVDVSSAFDADKEEMTLTFRQYTPNTPGQTDKQPVLLPVQLGVLNDQGQDIELQVSGAEWDASKSLLLIDQAEQTVTLSGIQASHPVVSIFRDFSAPIRLNYQQNDAELLRLLAADSDGFNRWDAGQRLMLTWIERAEQQQAFELNDAEHQALQSLLMDETLDPAMVAYCLTVPSETYIAESRDRVDPVSVHHARERVVNEIANRLAADLLVRYQQLTSEEEYAPVPSQMTARSLRNLCLHYLVRAQRVNGDKGLALAQDQFVNASNMTDSMAALQSILASGESATIETSLNDFYGRWQHDALVVNQWLAVQSGSAATATAANIKSLLTHEAFDWRNPNKVRSVLGAFANQALVHFHNHDGSGYRVLADAVIRLNQSNPQIAARLLGPLTKWQRVTEQLAVLMKEELERILASGDLSKDVYEVVSKSLAN